MMELVNPAIDQRLVHPAMQPVEVGIEQEEVERVFERNDPPAGGLAVEQDPAVFLQVGRAIAEDEAGDEQIDDSEHGFVAKREPLESLRLDLACLEEAFGDADCQADQQERPEPEGEQMIAATRKNVVEGNKVTVRDTPGGRRS